jgi:hypothetical protein
VGRAAGVPDEENMKNPAIAAPVATKKPHFTPDPPVAPREFLAVNLGSPKLTSGP